MTNKPIISIVVLTYNSSKYIFDTLNSAYAQTYKGGIELIITDDCSRDNTIELCQQWLLVHSDRFVKVELLTANENMGVSKNVNRGCRAAQGEWIKPIAGDDVLTDNCLEVMYTKASEIGEKCTFITSSVYLFSTYHDLLIADQLDCINWVPPSTCIDLTYAFNYPSFIVPAPSFFLSKKMLDKIGYYPEIFKNIEDTPLTRKVLSEGYVIHAINDVVAFYRTSNSQSITNTFLNELTGQRIAIKCYELYLRPIFTITQRWDTFFRLLPLRINILLGGKAKFLVSFAFVIFRYFRISFYKKQLIS